MIRKSRLLPRFTSLSQLVSAILMYELFYSRPCIPSVLHCVWFSFRANSIKSITRNKILLRVLIKTNGSNDLDLIIMLIISYSENF